MRLKAIMVSLIAAFSIFLLTGCSPVSFEPDDSGAYDRGIKALGNADFDTAMSEFKAAIEVDGRAAEGYRGQGLVYYQRGDFKYAVNLFDLALDSMAVENEEFKEDVMYYKGESLVKSLQIDSATSVYEDLTAGLRPYLANANLGRIYLNKGENTKANEYFEKATEGNTDFEVYLMIYESYKEKSLDADGTRFLEKALELTPKTAKDFENLGKIYYCLEDYDKAVEALLKAVDEGDEDAVTVLGSLYLELNNIPGARALYEEAMKKGMSQAKCYNGLALCSLAEGQADIALQYIQEGLKTADDESRRSLLFNEIIAYEKMEDFSGAKQKAFEYIADYPNDAKIKRELMFLTNVE